MDPPPPRAHVSTCPSSGSPRFHPPVLQALPTSRAPCRAGAVVPAQAPPSADPHASRSCSRLTLPAMICTDPRRASEPGPALELRCASDAGDAAAAASRGSGRQECAPAASCPATASAGAYCRCVRRPPASGLSRQCLEWHPDDAPIRAAQRIATMRKEMSPPVAAAGPSHLGAA